jgi:hypothetical protein
VDANHTLIAKMFEKKVNFLLKGRKERQLAKRELLCLVGQFLIFFSIKDFFKKEDAPQKEFLEDLGLLIIKNTLTI